jgi:hypothetical protein
MSKPVSKTVINFWLDFLLVIIFVVLCWCAVVVQFIFPPGPDARDWQLWGWNYVQWRSFEFALLAVFALGVLIHVTLHWPWVCGIATARIMKSKSTAFRNDGIRTLYGVATLIVIVNVIGVAVAVAALTIQPATP